MQELYHRKRGVDNRKVVKSFDNKKIVSKFGNKSIVK
jgi:hypothetical protein